MARRVMLALVASTIFCFATMASGAEDEVAKWYREVAELRKKAERGGREAQYKIGWKLFENKIIDYLPETDWDAEREKNDAEAAVWFRKAAEQGHVEAQRLLGEMYDEGTGVPQNDAEAAKWFRKAAEMGDKYAERGIGRAYLFGLGVPENYTEAAKWFRKAADQGESISQYYLGRMYCSGVGMPEDHVEGVKWLRKAAEMGVTNAQEVLRTMRCPEDKNIE